MPAYKYQTADGKTKWYANFYYTDWLGEKKHKCKRGFDTRREAMEYEHSFIDQGSKDPTITFSSLVENYIEEMEPRLKPTTLERKKWIIEEKLIPYFGKMKICDIDSITIHRWQSHLLEYRDDKGKGYSPTYIHSMGAEMSAILNYAVKFYSLRINPCKATGIAGYSKAEEPVIWTIEQFKTFISYEHKAAYRLAFRILFYAGLRSGELLALTPEDVLNDGRISINKTYAWVNGKELFLTPKTQKGNRIIAVPKTLHKELKQYINDSWIEPEERIFYFGKGGLAAEFRTISDRAGLPRIRIHALRHSHASMLVNMGIDIKEISNRLGHESIGITLETYVHLYPNDDKELAKRLDTILISDSQKEHDAEQFVRSLKRIGGSLLNSFCGSSECTEEELLDIYSTKSEKEIQQYSIAISACLPLLENSTENTTPDF